MAATDTEKRLLLRNQNMFFKDFESAGRNSEKFLVELRKSKRQQEWNRRRTKEYKHEKESAHFLDVFQELQSGVDNCEVLERLKKCLAKGVNITADHLAALLVLFKESTEENKGKILDVLINLTFYSEDICKKLVEMKVFALVSGMVLRYKMEVGRNAIWVLTNLMHGVENFRAMMISFGFLDSLVEMVKLGDVPEETLRVVVWSLSSFGNAICRASKENLRVLVNFLQTYMIDQNEETARYATDTLINIINKSEDLIPSLLSTSTLPAIIQSLSTASEKLLYLHLKFINSILSSSLETNTDTLISLGLLKHLFDCLSHSHTKIRAEAFSCFYNIAAGSLSQKSLLVNTQVLNSCILNLYDPGLVSIEAAKVLKALACNLASSQYESIFSFGVLQQILPILCQTANKTLPFINDALSFVYQIISHLNENCLFVLRNSDFKDQLEDLIINSKCTENVQKIIDKLLIN